jgi:methionyl-tRNA formyltransferase
VARDPDANRIRGLHPWPHAVTFATASGSSSIVASRVLRGKAPGTILDGGGRVRVATGDGALDLIELQAEGGRPMPAREFWPAIRSPRTVLQPSA